MIKSSIDIKKSILRAALIGRTDKKEIIDFIKGNYPSVKVAVLWDVTKSDLMSLSSDDLKDILTQVDRIAAHKATAYVYSEIEQFGLLRMYTTIAEINRVIPVKKLFKNIQTAEEWLNELQYIRTPKRS